MIERVTNFRHKHLITLIGESHEDSQKTHVDSMVDLHVGDCQGNLSVIQLHHSLSERGNTSGATISVIVLVEGTFLDDLIASLGHLKLFLTIDGRVATHETNSLFLLMVGPSLKLVHELSQWEIDVLGKI